MRSLMQNIRSVFGMGLIIAIVGFSGCSQRVEDREIRVYDSHVHLMSPVLIHSWKNIGIPFSKPDDYYATIDTLLKKNGAQKIDLIGMGYVFGNPEFYQGSDVDRMLSQENDYLFFKAAKHPDRVRAFFTVDPLRPSALGEIDRCLSVNPNSGLKLHFNASRVYLTEPEHLAKIKAVFTKAATKKIPVLLHFDNGHPKFGSPDVSILVDSILKKIPPLNLRIAHCGTSGGFNEKTMRFLDAFILQFEEKNIPIKHSIRFDLSAVALDKDSEGVSKLTDGQFRDLKNYIDKIGHDKFVFGSDYPLYTASEYILILQERLGLTVTEIENMMLKPTEP